jgi:hypothetical protein
MLAYGRLAVGVFPPEIPSMLQDLTAAQRKRVRELAAVAYDRELGRELALLEGEFARWRQGELDVFGLSDRIHRFHDGKARQLFGVYGPDNAALAVASAIRRGLLTEVEAGEPIVTALRRLISID